MIKTSPPAPKARGYEIMLNINWVETLKDNKMLRRAGQDRSFLNRLEIRRAQLTGQLLRSQQLN